MKKRKKKDNQLNLYIGIIICIIIVGSFIYYFASNRDLESSLKNDGYVAEEEDAFYKHVVSGNTIDDFYNAVANGRDSYYEEYYLQKNSFDFIELKMYYENDVTANLNITSNLKNNYLEYNYELSGKDARLIIEGNSEHNYDCKPVMSENVSQKTFETCCDIISDELETYLNRRKEIMNNPKVMEELNK